MELPELNPSDDLISALAEIESTETHWLQISQKLRTRDAQVHDLQAGWLMAAFDYCLARRVRDASRKESAFTPAMISDIGSYPVVLSSVPEVVLDFWDSVAKRSSGTGSRARLHHLLFERRHGNPGDHARAAAAAYLNIGTSSLPRIERVNCLHWSHELSRSVGDNISADTVLEPLVAIAKESMAQVDPEPGVTLHALEVLVNEFPCQPQLPRLLDQARKRYLTPWLADETIRLQQKLAKGDATRIASLQREQVQGYLDLAGQSAGLLRMANFEDAAKLATSLGIADLLHVAIDGMQAMTIEDMEFKQTTIEFSLPAEVLERVVGVFVDKSTLAEGLLALATSEPPTGDVDRNMVAAEQVAVAAPFVNLISKKHVGNDALTRYTAANEDERIDEKLAEQENLHMTLGAEVTARSLEGLMARFTPSSEELAEIISAPPHVSTSVGVSLAKALQAFHETRWEEAATVSMPKIETLSRARLAAVGDLQFEVQRGQKRGQYPQLGAMLPKLKQQLDSSWYRFLRTFLVSPFGPNFRNELAHGFVDDVSRCNAALTLLTALHLALTPIPAADNH